ncbi:glycosyltransferase family 2 protein [Algiphilus sp.]|uniref:glycosyltransferase family 2 protein n=1 Tax=Algiphilus sp. TaxID=1872431 RepID=UPI003B51D12B
MKFSIVTISYNQASFLERAILSVIEQDYPNLEYIVVDPGSDDGSRAIIERYRDRIDKIIFEPDEGPADGLNKGFGCATGDIYGYINSDDALLPGALAKVAEAARQSPDAGIIAGHLYMVGQGDQLIRRVRASQIQPKEFVYGGAQVAQQSTFIRASAFWNVGGFNVHNNCGWDAELLLDLVVAGEKVEIVDDYLAIFKIHATSISGSARLLADHRENCKRYFVRVMGRAPTRLDNLRRVFYKIKKWQRDPRGFFYKLQDRFFLPHKFKI